MTQEIDLFPEDIDADNLHELRVGQIGTVKGKLENVRYGGGMHTARGVTQNPRWGDPSLTVTFPDWSMLAVALRDYHTAKSIPYPLGTYVAVKVQCINEDAELMALAIWELGSNPVPIALAEPTHVCTTVPEPRP